MAYKVFISHTAAEADLPFLDEILRRSATMGIQCYMAQHDTQAGTSLKDKLRQQILESNCVLVFITKSSINSDWVKIEMGIAEGLQKLVVPVLENGVSCPSYLLGKEYIPFDPQDVPRTAEATAKYIGRLAIETEKKNAIGVLLLAGLVTWALLAKS
jgi:hypothetical protein